MTFLYLHGSEEELKYVRVGAPTFFVALPIHSYPIRGTKRTGGKHRTNEHSEGLRTEFNNNSF
jgi:hypothetical protein